MAVWDLHTSGGTRKVIEGDAYEALVPVETDVAACVLAIMSQSNETIMQVVDDLLDVMDDADLYREWAKKVSDGYVFEYGTN